MACRLYNTERCLQLQLFNRPNFGVHFNPLCQTLCVIIEIEVMLSRQPDFLVVEIVDHDGMAIL